ncbi:MAG: hypothetical protein ABFC89_04600 [Methanospirillum sp.]
MAGLNILVEGSDDVRFFERVLVPRLKERYGSVRLVPYACLRRTAVDRLLRSFARLGEPYVIVADIDTEPSVRAKKRAVLARFAEAEPGAIAVVVMEIESWYLAGADDGFLARAGLVPLPTTDDLTKEAFNALIPRGYVSRIGFMLDLLDGYSVDRGAERNRSLSFFLRRFGVIHK